MMVRWGGNLGAEESVEEKQRETGNGRGEKEDRDRG